MLALLLMLAMPQKAPGLPEITITRTSPDHYVVTAPNFAATELKAFEAETMARAAKLCKGMRLVWGDNSFRRGGPEGGIVVDYRREFFCSVDDLAKFPPAPADWRATPADESDARAAFTGFYDDVDAGRFDAAYARFEDGVIPDREGWADDERTLVARLGAGARRVTRVRWMVNPPGGAHPGVFAIVLFQGDHANTHYYCGMIAMYRRAPGRYDIVREDRSVFFDRGEKFSPGEIEDLKASECPR